MVNRLASAISIDLLDALDAIDVAQETVQFCIDSGKTNIYYKIISSLTDGHSTGSQTEDI